MTQLLGEFLKEQNGVVSDSMRDRGVVYGLNYGVAVPSIKRIALPYAFDQDLAQLLWQQQVRELRLSALVIANPQSFVVGDLEFWRQGVDNIELAEHLAMFLAKSGSGDEIVAELLSATDRVLQYTALMVGARVELRGEAMEAVERVCGVDDAMLRRGVEACLMRQSIYNRGRVEQILQQEPALSALRAMK